MNLIRNIIAFFRLVGAFFKKWFLPYAYPPDDEKEKPVKPAASPPEKNKPSRRSVAALPPRPKSPPAWIEPNEAVLNALARANARTPQMLAKETGLAEKTCREALDALAQDQQLRKGGSGEWRTLTPEARRNILINDPELSEAMEKLSDEEFREHVLELILDILDRRPASIELQDHAILLLLRGRRQGRLLLGGDSATLEWNGQINAEQSAQLRSAGCRLTDNGPRDWTIEWPPYANHKQFQQGLDACLNLNRPSHRRRPRRKNARSNRPKSGTSLKN
ncbi:hypothetical protein JXA32_08505 [Candidatus Sumerlaeota bacterium]|nr:hypothetical protein [Candidatus Sumerlaeota bacterium]